MVVIAGSWRPALALSSVEVASIPGLRSETKHRPSILARVSGDLNPSSRPRGVDRLVVDRRVSLIAPKTRSLHLLVMVLLIVLPRSRCLFQMSLGFESNRVALTHIILLWVVVSWASVGGERFGIVGVARAHSVLGPSFGMRGDVVVSWTWALLSVILISLLSPKREFRS